MKHKLLIVEDDPNLGQILNDYLNLKGFKATLCRNGEEGFKAYLSGRFDMCILDIMMPKKDGFSLAADIRERDNQMPIIFLTAKSMKEDAIKGFKIGADDYVTKPFSMEELLLRIKAVLKRSNNESKAENISNSYQIGSILFEVDKQRLLVGENETKLTTKEAQLLEFFCRHMGQVVPRNIALKNVWGDDSYFNARSMDVYIAKLRKHLKIDEKVQLITVHREGFKLFVL